MVPHIICFNLGFFFYCKIVQKCNAVSRNCTSNFELWYLLGQQHVIWSCPATPGSGSDLQLSSSRAITRENDLYAYSCSVPIQPFCSSLSVQYLIHYIGFSTLNYKKSFVLNDFVQLQGNVSVLSLVRSAKLSGDV